MTRTYDMDLIYPGFFEEHYDYFIMAPNVEERSTSVLLSCKRNLKCDNLILVDYVNFHHLLDREGREKFFDAFNDFSKTIINATTDEDVFTLLQSINLNGSIKLGIDITGFSIPSIYRIIHYLYKVRGIEEFDVFYTEPKHYVYEEGYFDSYHRDKKPRSCAPILGYYKSGTDTREVLTIFLGFDGGLADLVYGKLGEEGKEIVKTIVVNGFPSYTAKLKDVSLFNNEDIINKIPEKNVMSASANNPFDVYNTLEKIKQESNGILLNLCTIGSKPMALGTCLFALDNAENVKVTYPFYTKTKFDTSEKAGKMWRYGVNFRKG